MSFEFRRDTSVPIGKHGLMPRGIETKSSLMEAISDALDFPDYFGRNWDALDECIRDLSWLPAGAVTLEHVDLPLAQDPPSLGIYLDILNRAVLSSRETQNPLIVAFPRGSREPGAVGLVRDRRESRTLVNLVGVSDVIRRQ